MFRHPQQPPHTDERSGGDQAPRSRQNGPTRRGNLPQAGPIATVFGGQATPHGD